MSDGKCTKGINLYATTIDSTHDLIILDTEGLNSQETRNIDFEIQLAVFLHDGISYCNNKLQERICHRFTKSNTIITILRINS